MNWFTEVKAVLLDIQLLSMDQKREKLANTLNHTEYSYYFLDPYQQVSKCKYLYNSDSKLKCNISDQSCQVIHYMYKNCLFCNNSMTTITNSNFEIKSAQPPLVLVFYTCFK